MSARVLIVDDCADTLESLVTLMSVYGYHARGVPDAASALRAVPEFRPCVVVTDLRLPGDSGEVLAERLLSLPTPRPKVIALSGLMDVQNTRDRLSSLGVDDCLTKPADPAELVDRIRDLCAC